MVSMRHFTFICAALHFVNGDVSLMVTGNVILWKQKESGCKKLISAVFRMKTDWSHCYGTRGDISFVNLWKNQTSRLFIAHCSELGGYEMLQRIDLKTLIFYLFWSGSPGWFSALLRTIVLIPKLTIRWDQQFWNLLFFRSFWFTTSKPPACLTTTGKRIRIPTTMTIPCITSVQTTARKPP